MGAANHASDLLPPLPRDLPQPLPWRHLRPSNLQLFPPRPVDGSRKRQLALAAHWKDIPQSIGLAVIVESKGKRRHQLATAQSQLLRLHVADMRKSTMAPRLGHLLYLIASWIAVILIAGGIVVWLYFARPNYDPLGLVIVAWGIIVWLGGRAIRYWLAGR
jgi:hypothetical protein